MLNRIFLSGVIFIVVACAPAVSTPFVTDPASTSNVTSIPPTMTLTAEHSETSLPIASPTSMAAAKSVLILHGITAGDGADEDYICLKWRYPNPLFVLYEDGQLIIYSDEMLVEKMLTQQEVHNLLTQIENTGYFGIGDRPGPIEENPLYELPGPVQYGDGGPSETLTVKNNTIWINNVLAPYVAKPVKDTLAIINEYRPSDMESYYPEQLLLIVLPFREQHSYVKTPVPQRSEWPSELPPLEEMDYLTRLDSASTQLLLNSQFFETLPSVRIFTQDNVEYSVVACPLLP